MPSDWSLADGRNLSAGSKKGMAALFFCWCVENRKVCESSEREHGCNATMLFMVDL